jgi:hypothetical protein
MILEMKREEQERLRTAIEKAGAEIAPALGDKPLETKDVLLYLAERFLRTDPAGTPAGRQERTESPYTILYHRCDTCRRARMMTDDGPVEVSPESVDRIEDDAAVEVLKESGGGEDASAIDRPNPASFARRVKLRDGGMCQNPGCRHRGQLHAHHIHHRAKGGRTVLSNSTAVCSRCHALLHAGLLTVSGDPFSDLKWRPRSNGIALGSGPDASALKEVPIVQLPSAIADITG